MSWNYRVFKDKNGEVSLRETYYLNESNGAQITSWSESARTPITHIEDKSDTPIESLRWQLTAMLGALKEPLLDEEALLREFEQSEQKSDEVKQT